jgi:hypothetical protein
MAFSDTLLGRIQAMPRRGERFYGYYYCRR